MKKVFQDLRVQFSVKNSSRWFLFSFLGILLVFLFVFKKSIGFEMLIEALGFTFVFVLLMAGTKVYSNFIHGYYQSFLNRYQRK